MTETKDNGSWEEHDNEVICGLEKGLQIIEAIDQADKKYPQYIRQMGVDNIIEIYGHYNHLWAVKHPNIPNPSN